MGYLEHIITYLTDKQRKISSKAAFIILIIVGIIIIDNSIGFSYYQRTDKKIRALQNLNALIVNSETDSITRRYAMSLRDDVIKRKSIPDHVWSFFRNIKLTSSKKDQTTIPDDTPKTIDSPIRNNFIFYLSSGGIYFLFGLIISFAILFTKDTPLDIRLGSSVGAFVIFTFFSMMLYWILDFIPLLESKSWIWNYLLNSTIQVLVLGIVAIIGKRQS